jgi:hypothetical protein
LDTYRLEIDIGPGERATGGFIREFGRKDSEVLIFEIGYNGGRRRATIGRRWDNRGLRFFDRMKRGIFEFHFLSITKKENLYFLFFDLVLLVVKYSL